MAWLNDRLGQIIAGLTVAGTLAGFGYEGAKTINRIDNLEATISSSTDSNSSQVASLVELEKKVILIEQQLSSLAVPDISGLSQDVAVLKNHKHPLQVIPQMPDLSGIKKDIEKIESDLSALKNKKDNPLLN